MMVSVVVITKNNITTIEKCIQSLINQKYPKELMEIIFVDGHSSDGTDNVIKKYAKAFPFIRLYYEDVGTMGYARNVGIKNSRGEIIMFTDADAFPVKSWIRRIVDAFSSDPKIAIVGGLDILIDANDVHSIIDSWRRLRRSYGINAIPKIKTVNFAIRRDILLKVGGFDERLSHADEGDLKARVYSTIKEAEILYDPKIIVYHQRGPMKIGHRVKKLFKKSSMGVPVLLRKHMLRVYLRNISSPAGTSLCFIFACLLSPLLLLYLLFFTQCLIPFLISIVSIGAGVIVFYIISVKRATGRWFFSIPFILVLDIVVRFAGTFHGLIKWFFIKLRGETT
jgi:glycosyltransferase involved in cell wall biosynthesis